MSTQVRSNHTTARPTETDLYVSWYDADSFPMDAAMRLLIALSGGQDRRTFRLEDPTRVALEVSSDCILVQQCISDDEAEALTLNLCMCIFRSRYKKRADELGNTFA